MEPIVPGSSYLPVVKTFYNKARNFVRRFGSLEFFLADASCGFYIFRYVIQNFSASFLKRYLFRLLYILLGYMSNFLFGKGSARFGFNGASSKLAAGGVYIASKFAADSCVLTVVV